MMPRRETGVAERLRLQVDAVAAWASGLTTEQRDRATARGVTAGVLADAIVAGRDKSEGLDPLDLSLAEAAVVLDALAVGDAVGMSPPFERSSLAGAVRTTLAEFARRSPGRLIEVRVPPWGAVQVGIPGVVSVHRRGTPPNVVECDALTWLRLAGGVLRWADAVAGGSVLASGSHAQLGDLLPL